MNKKSTSAIGSNGGTTPFHNYLIVVSHYNYNNKIRAIFIATDIFSTTKC